MRQHKHLSRENFDQHISEVNLYMNKVDGSLSDNRGWDAMTCELVESLRENHTGSFELSDVFERTMNTVWDRILYDSQNSPQDLVKTYYATSLIDESDLSGPRIYVETFSFLSEDKWSLNTTVGLLTNNHNIGSALVTKESETEHYLREANVIDIRQRGQFDALRDKPKTPEQRLEALEHDLTEIMSVLINKDIMRSY